MSASPSGICGVGGASRYLAYSHGCQVEAMDLTQEFVDAAVRLTELCGLADKINFRQGDVTELHARGRRTPA